MSERTFIDPEKFAFSFADSTAKPTEDKGDVVPAAKKYLLHYLTAYYLVEDFNAEEAKNFTSSTEEHFKDMSFGELLDRVQKLNKY
ncbi:hypothetical protein [Lacticaseibacillus nasuensis]|uniref:hypothetical protein n=1 Tax=Lacticaseibacillus nasuensis TaxID=944671 RepID=UPI0022458AEC|nr:hypothetical protein [Lacticaseibacillus nasuensis]MCX2456369.1 hypothetical protein [Lacticaseibacillus nasuensis]